MVLTSSGNTFYFSRKATSLKYTWQNHSVPNNGKLV